MHRPDLQQKLKFDRYVKCQAPYEYPNFSNQKSGQLQQSQQKQQLQQQQHQQTNIILGRHVDGDNLDLIAPQTTNNIVLSTANSQTRSTFYKTNSQNFNYNNNKQNQNSFNNTNTSNFNQTQKNFKKTQNQMASTHSQNLYSPVQVDRRYEVSIDQQSSSNKFLAGLHSETQHNFNSSIVPDHILHQKRSQTSYQNKKDKIQMDIKSKNLNNITWQTKGQLDTQTQSNMIKKYLKTLPSQQSQNNLDTNIQHSAQQKQSLYNNKNNSQKQFTNQKIKQTIYHLDSSHRTTSNQSPRSDFSIINQKYQKGQQDYIKSTKELFTSEQKKISGLPNVKNDSKSNKLNDKRSSFQKYFSSQQNQQQIQQQSTQYSDSLLSTSQLKKQGFHEDESHTKQTKTFLLEFQQQKQQKQLKVEQDIALQSNQSVFLVLKDENLLQAKNKIQLSYCYHTFSIEKKTFRESELKKRILNLKSKLKQKLKIFDNQPVYLYYQSGQIISSPCVDSEQTIIILSSNPGFSGILDIEKYQNLLENIIPKLEHNVILQRKLLSENIATNSNLNSLFQQMQMSNSAQDNLMLQVKFNKKYQQNFEQTKENFHQTKQSQNIKKQKLKKIRNTKLSQSEQQLALPTPHFKNHSLIQPFHDKLSPLQSQENILTNRGRHIDQVESYETKIKNKYQASISNIINVLSQKEEQFTSAQLENLYKEVQKNPRNLTKFMNNPKHRLKLSTNTPQQSITSMQTHISTDKNELRHGNYDWENIQKREYLESSQVLNKNQKIKDLEKIDHHYEEQLEEIKFIKLEDYKENRYQIKKREPVDKISRLLKGRSKIQILAEQMGIFKNQSPVKHVTLYSPVQSPRNVDMEKTKKKYQKQDENLGSSSSEEYEDNSSEEEEDEEDSDNEEDQENQTQEEDINTSKESQKMLDKIAKKQNNGKKQQQQDKQQSSSSQNITSSKDRFQIVEKSDNRLTINDLDFQRQISQQNKQKEFAKKLIQENKIKEQQQKQSHQHFNPNHIFGNPIRAKQATSHYDPKEINSQIPEILDKVIQVQQNSPIKPQMSHSNQQYNWEPMSKNKDSIKQDQDGQGQQNSDMENSGILSKKTSNQQSPLRSHPLQTAQSIPLNQNQFTSILKGKLGQQGFIQEVEEDEDRMDDQKQQQEDEQEETIPLIDRFEIDFPEEGDDHTSHVVQNQKALENKKEVLRKIGKLNVNLQEINIPKILKEIPEYFQDATKKNDEPTTFTRNDIHQMYILYKALHEVTSQRYKNSDYNIKDGVDYETYRNGIYQVYMQSEEVAQRIFNIIDYNFSGFMDWDEFLKLIVSIRAKTLSEKINLFIKIADEDGNGRLSWSEIYELAKICLRKFIINDDDGFLNMLCEYYTKLIFETVKVDIEDEIPLELIKFTIINGKNADGDLLCMFCGADI